MKFKTRRFTGTVPRLVRHSWEDISKELQEFLEKLFLQVLGGIPPGFNNVTPQNINANNTAAAGAEGDGWASASHVHDVDTAAPSNPTGKTPVEGVSGALMRADATVQQGIVTTKGDLLTHDNATAERLAVGTDGQVLNADSAETTGLKWIDPGASSTLVLAVKAFLEHMPRIPKAQAGTGMSIVENALGPEISAVIAFDQSILASQIFGG